MTTRVATLVVIAALAGGCGGTKAKNVAQLVPADATAFVQLTGARPPAASTFPFAPSAYAELERALPRALTSAARTIDIALLPQGAVAFAQPKDRKAFEAAVEAKGLVHRRTGRFTLVARTQAALDAVRHARAKLADDPRYLAASKSLADAPLTAYLSPRFRGDAPAGVPWVALEVTRTSVRIHYRASPPYPPPLTGVAVPNDTVAGVGLGGGDVPASTLPVLGKISGAFGLDLRALQHALDGPAFAYLERGGDVVPRVTVRATPLHPARALGDVGRLLAPLGRPAAGPAPNLTALDLGPLGLYYGLDRGRFVISDDETAAEDRAARSAIDGLPDSVTRFAYEKGAGPAVAAIAPGLGLSPPRPRRDFLLYETRDGPIETRVLELLS